MLRLLYHRGERPQTHLIAGWLVLRASLGVLEKRNVSSRASDGIRTLDRPDRSVACIYAIFDEVATGGT